MMFNASKKEKEVVSTDNYYDVPAGSEIMTGDGWEEVEKVRIGDMIPGSEKNLQIKNIEKIENNYRLFI